MQKAAMALIEPYGIEMMVHALIVLRLLEL